MLTYQSKGTSESFLVMVSRIAYKPQITANLDGAMRGAMTNAAAEAGDSSPNYSTSSTAVSGIPALTSSYKHVTRGHNLHLDAIIAARGAKMWQVQVIYFNDSNAADAARILHSLAITH